MYLFKETILSFKLFIQMNPHTIKNCVHDNYADKFTYYIETKKK